MILMTLILYLHIKDLNEEELITNEWMQERYDNLKINYKERFIIRSTPLPKSLKELIA